jgi:hypothetical protein
VKKLPPVPATSPTNPKRYKKKSLAKDLKTGKKTATYFYIYKQKNRPYLVGRSMCVEEILLN